MIITLDKLRQASVNMLKVFDDENIDSLSKIERLCNVGYGFEIDAKTNPDYPNNNNDSIYFYRRSMPILHSLTPIIGRIDTSSKLIFAYQNSLDRLGNLIFSIDKTEGLLTAIVNCRSTINDYKFFKKDKNHNLKQYKTIIPAEVYVVRNELNRLSSLE